MKQKTVRFYTDSKSDMEAYEKLKCHKEYGFNNAREFIIDAINSYTQRGRPHSDIDIDRLADLIAQRIKQNKQVLSSTEEPNDSIKDDEIMERALSFMESL